MSRVRTQGTFSSTSGYNGGSVNGVPWSPTTYTSVDMMGEKKVMTDETDSHFYKNQRNGVLTIRPCTRARMVRNSGAGSWSVVGTASPWYVYEGSGHFLDYFFMSIEPQYASEEVVQKAAVSAHAGVVKTDTLSAVSLFELRKTIELFQEAGRRAQKAHTWILKFYNEVRAGKHPSVLRNFYKHTGRKTYELSDAASRYWLEYRYGWLPLYYDIRGHISAFNKDRTVWNVSRGSASDTQSWVKPDHWGSPGFGGKWGFHATRYYTDTVTARCGVYYTDDLSPERRLAEDLGLSASHTPIIAWELMPWSFVIDWFIDVGSWLEAIRPKPGVRYLGSYTVVKHNLVVQRILQDCYCTGQGNATGSSSPQTWTWDTYTRTPNCSAPLTPPIGSGVGSIVRQISAAALSFQQLKRLVTTKR